MLDVRLLGVSEVRRDGTTVAVGGRQPRAVVAALALAGARAVTTEALIGAVWGPEPPHSARATLQSTVSRLRHVLGPDHGITTVPGGYRWELRETQLDVARFRRLVRRASGASEPWRAAVDLREALEEWRGPPLADLRGTPVHATWADLLEQERVTAEVAEAESLIVCGQADEAARRVVALIEEHPLDERLRAAAIRALAASGQVPEALTAYDDWRRTLARELGTSPSASVLALHDELVTGNGGSSTPRVAREGRLGQPRLAPRSGTGMVAAQDGVIGRGSLIDVVLDDLRSTSILSLHGEDGVGLSTVGRRLVRDARDRFDRAEVVAAIAGGGWLAGAAARRLGLEPDPPDDVRGAFAFAFRSRPVLLVLDDVTDATEDDARSLALELTAANPSTRVVLLHRSGAPPSSRVVPPLPHGDEHAPATQLVLRLARSVDAWDRDVLGAAEARDLGEMLAGSPLAIQVATRTLEVLPAGKLIPELRDRLTVGDDPLTAAVEIALTTLPEPAAPLLRMLACVDTGLPPDEVAILATRAGTEPGRAPLATEAALARGLLVWTDDRSRLVVPRSVRRRLALDGDAWRTVRAAIARSALTLLDRETTVGSTGEATWLRQVRARYPDLRSLIREALEDGDLAAAASLIRGLARWWEVEGDRDEAEQVSAALLGALPADATVWRAGLHEVRGRLAVARRRREEDGADEFRSALELDPAAPPLTVARRERLLAAATTDPVERRRLLASAADRLDGRTDAASRREHAATDLHRAHDAAVEGDVRRSRGLVDEARRRLVGVDAHDLRLALDLLEHRLELPADAVDRDRRLAAQHHELTRRRQQATGRERLQLDLDLAWREVLLGALGPARERLAELRQAAERVGSRRIGSEAAALAAHLARGRHEDRLAGELADEAEQLDVGGPGVDALVLATRAWVAWRAGDIRGAAEAGDTSVGRWPTPPDPHPLAWATDLVLVALGGLPGRLAASLDAAGRCVAAEPPWLPPDVRRALARYIADPNEGTRDDAVNAGRDHRLL